MTDSHDASVSRRTVVGGLAAAGTIAAFAVAANEGAVPIGASASGGGPFGGQGTSPLATAEVDAWQAVVGSDFGIARTTMRLVGVEPLASPGARPRGLRRKAFVAVFELPVLARLPGDLIYTISSAGRGTFDLFLVEGAGRFTNRLKAVLN